MLKTSTHEEIYQGHAGADWMCCLIPGVCSAQLQAKVRSTCYHGHTSEHRLGRDRPWQVPGSFLRSLLHLPRARFTDPAETNGAHDRGVAFETPFATFYTPNLTSDTATGTGGYSDKQLARAIRYSISHHGSVLVPFMTYNAMSDADLTAIISYLRTTTPVRNEVPPHDLNMVGKILMRFVMKPPVVVPENIAPDTTAEYGRYLAYNVANCRGCHTNRGTTGQFVGDPFAGGYRWDLETATSPLPTSTPHDTTGWIYAWSEQDFINRFKRGKTFPDSPMPWEAYRGMSENDVKALYRFLRSLPPSRNKVERTYEEKTGV